MSAGDWDNCATCGALLRYQRRGARCPACERQTDRAVEAMLERRQPEEPRPCQPKPQR